MPEGGSERSVGLGFEEREGLGERELVGWEERGYRRVVIAWTL